MKKIWDYVRTRLPTAPSVMTGAGGGLFVVGVGLVYLPAGLMAGGILLFVCGVIAFMGGGGE